MASEQTSDIQLRIYTFIAEYIREEGMPPTNREIGAAMKFASTGHVDYHLKMLEKKGLIAREAKKPRGIKLVQHPFGIPVMGTIAAGEPLEVFSDPSESIEVGREMEQQGTYALVVKGQSMIEDHICDKDYVVIKPQSTCENGDIVVAVHLQGNKGRATLKRFFQEKERDRVRLQPANSEMDPIYVSRSEWDQEWQVQGRVIALFRDWRFSHKSYIQEQGSDKLAENFEQENLSKANDLDLYAIVRTTLEEDNTAFVHKTYVVQAGISQSKPGNFWGEPFNLQVENAAEILTFDILMLESENIELITSWHQRLRYKPDNTEPQLVEFEFRVIALGKSSLVIDFYHERRWLRTIRFEIDAIEQSHFAPILSEV